MRATDDYSRNSRAVAVPRRGAGDEGGVLLSGRPAAALRAAPLASVSRRLNGDACKRRAVMVQIEARPGCEQPNTPRRTDHDDRQDDSEGSH